MINFVIFLICVIVVLSFLKHVPIMSFNPMGLNDVVLMKVLDGKRVRNVLPHAIKNRIPIMSMLKVYYLDEGTFNFDVDELVWVNAENIYKYNGELTDAKIKQDSFE